MSDGLIQVSYFPGCSLATSARESNESLIRACGYMGLELVELEDWNCCGSSSAHSLDHDLALGLAARNLGLAPKDRPLMIMCPSCYRNQIGALTRLQADGVARRHWERRWGLEIDPGLQIVSFMELMKFMERLRAMGTMPELDLKRGLGGLKVALYMGCMSMFPPSIRPKRPSADVLIHQLKEFGAEMVTWPHQDRCCGTFLSVARPDIVTPMVNDIMNSALNVGADCLVTACAMCQLNLEIRATIDKKPPILHFTEVAALVLGARDSGDWFARHLVDPRPMLKAKGLTGDRA
jgi:heterodisulfide reductase subunit B